MRKRGRLERIVRAPSVGAVARDHTRGGAPATRVWSVASRVLTMRTERGVGLRPPPSGGTLALGSGTAGVSLPLVLTPWATAAVANMFPVEDWMVECGSGGGGRCGSQDGYPSLSAGEGDDTAGCGRVGKSGEWGEDEAWDSCGREEDML